MVLYTPLAIEDIYPEEEVKYETISYQGKTVLAKQREDNHLQLVQLISTDPDDYLHPSFAPGEILNRNYIHE